VWKKLPLHTGECSGAGVGPLLMYVNWSRQPGLKFLTGRVSSGHGAACSRGSAEVRFPPPEPVHTLRE